MLHWGTCEVVRVEGTYCKEEKEMRNRQGKDPMTCEGNSQGGDLATPKANSQGEDPRTFKEPVEKMRAQKKWKEKSWKKKKEKDKKKKVKSKRSSLWKKGERKD